MKLKSQICCQKHCSCVSICERMKTWINILGPVWLQLHFMLARTQLARNLIIFTPKGRSLLFLTGCIGKFWTKLIRDYPPDLVLWATFLQLHLTFNPQSWAPPSCLLSGLVHGFILYIYIQYTYINNFKQALDRSRPFSHLLFVAVRQDPILLLGVEEEA